MNFLRSRSEQLADYLRGCIARGELHEPLPGTRPWAEALDVSPTTLRSALKTLRREGLLLVEPRKPIHLASLVVPRRAAEWKIARVVHCAAEYPDRSFLPWFPELAEHLLEHGIHVALESCTFARLRALSRQEPALRDLLVLASIPADYQALFVPLKHRVLVLGHRSPNVPFSYVNVDVDGAVRHSTHSLLRRGLTRLSFLLEVGTAQGLRQAVQTFQQTCRQWPQQPVRAEVVQMRLPAGGLAHDVEQFAARVRPRQGIVVLDPVPVTMLVAALLARGLRLPEEVEVRGVMTTPGSVQLCHPPPCYPYPLRDVVKHTARAVVRYFKTGVLPRMHHTAPAEPASSSG
jgi:DNA-binding LacI/PurR family transcriptional regulator